MSDKLPDTMVDKPGLCCLGVVAGVAAGMIVDNADALTQLAGSRVIRTAGTG